MSHNNICPCFLCLFLTGCLSPDIGSPLSHAGEGTDDLALVIRELGAVEGHVEAQGPSPGGVGGQASIEDKLLGHYRLCVLSHGNGWSLRWSLGSVIP